MLRSYGSVLPSETLVSPPSRVRGSTTRSSRRFTVPTEKVGTARGEDVGSLLQLRDRIAQFARSLVLGTMSICRAGSAAGTYVVGNPNSCRTMLTPWAIAADL